jgi:hypothetical protein
MLSAAKHLVFLAKKQTEADPSLPLRMTSLEDLSAAY